MGRPRNFQTRDHQLNISLTAAEYEVLHRRAYQQGSRLVDYVRSVLFFEPVAASAPNLPDAPVATRADHMIYVQLKRLGNNLNQIARQLNMTGDAPPRDLYLLLRDIRAVLNRGMPRGS